jgi:hypothetical protein
MGCFAVSLNAVYKPVVFNWAVDNYDDDGHQVHTLIRQRIVFMHSFTTAQVAAFDIFYGNISSTSPCSFTDFSVIYYAKITKFTLVSQEQLLLSEAKKCGVEVAETNSLLEEAMNKKKRMKPKNINLKTTP